MKRGINVNNIIYSMFKLVAILFLVFQILFNIIDINENGRMQFYNGWIFFLIGSCVVLLGFFICRKLLKCNNLIWIAIVLFSIALIPRLAVMFLYEYVPTNDFKNYVNFGNAFIKDGIAGMTQAISTYSMPEMGGLVILYGLISFLFNGSILGYVLTNCFLTSFITLCVFYIGNEYKKEVGIIGALLFAAYPMNIISAQITTNHHGAILFTLLALCLFDKQCKTNGNFKKLLYAGLCGLSLTISNFWHASIIIPVLAICGYGIIRCMHKFENKRKILLSFLDLCRAIILFFIINSACLLLITNLTGLKVNTNFWSKIYVGINKDTRGTYNLDDYQEFANLNSKECISLITERLDTYSLEELADLLKDKMNIIWFGGDSYSDFYIESIALEYYDKSKKNELSDQENTKYLKIFRLMSDLKSFDRIYVNLIYVFWVLGVILRKRKEDNILDCILWLILGWIGVHIFIEVQPRYRYLAMPSMIIFASIGIFEIQKLIIVACEKRKQARNRTTFQG